jgi:hypothetical protein
VEVGEDEWKVFVVMVKGEISANINQLLKTLKPLLNSLP